PRYVAEDVCILSNMWSFNFCHFTEELLKVIILERAKFSGPYVYTNLPKFAFEFWDALGLDRRSLMQVSPDPAIFRSALYTTNLNFGDLANARISSSSYETACSALLRGLPLHLGKGCGLTVASMLRIEHVTSLTQRRSILFSTGTDSRD